jgi:hypothetical protein
MLLMRPSDCTREIINGRVDYTKRKRKERKGRISSDWPELPKEGGISR